MKRFFSERQAEITASIQPDGVLVITDEEDGNTICLTKTQVAFLMGWVADAMDDGWKATTE